MERMLRIIPFGLTLVLVAPTSVVTASEDLHQLFDEYWDHEMEINPFAETSSRINLFNDRMTAQSPATRAHILEISKSFEIWLDDTDLLAADSNDKRGGSN